MVHYMPKEKVKLAYWLLDCMIMIHHQCVKKKHTVVSLFVEYKFS